MVARFACFARVATTCWIIAVSAFPAYANPFEWMWRVPKKVASDIAQETRRRNCWPEPFVEPDRQAVRAPFGTMVTLGWRQQNLIAAYHFGEDGVGLTEVGRHKIRWILFEVPPQHRTIYVQMADDPEVTAARLIEVQDLVVQLAPHGELPQVLQTHISPRGWPAEWVDTVGRKFNEATPAPVLPAAKESTAF